MFAIAILDKNLNKLFLIRDRLGVKPLYYYKKDKTILFSSEIKTFLKYNDFDKSIDFQSIHNYLSFNYVPIPETVYKYVKHVRPGSFLQIDYTSNEISEIRYWDIENFDSSITNENEIIENIDYLLTDSTKLRVRSDVEVGAFLSGGLDSSLVCQKMNDIGHKNFKTFTIGFVEKIYDETNYAKYINNKLSLKENIFTLDYNIAENWSKVMWFNDQPHGDLSFIPTYLLAEKTSKHVKVVLTGDGGDEVFAGYTKYRGLEKKSVISKEYFDAISLFKESDFLNLYNDSFIQDIDLKKPKNIFDSEVLRHNIKDDVNAGLYFDVKQLLPGNNLVKPDKMAMANGLETRSPFLDYRFYEYMFRVPGNLKLINNETKYILKKYSLKYFNHDHVYRDKQMFTVPVGDWFKNSLKDLPKEILLSPSFKNRGIFNSDYVLMMITEHQAGRKNFTREIRALISLEFWFKNFID